MVIKKVLAEKKFIIQMKTWWPPKATWATLTAVASAAFALRWVAFSVTHEISSHMLMPQLEPHMVACLAAPSAAVGALALQSGEAKKKETKPKLTKNQNSMRHRSIEVSMASHGANMYVGNFRSVWFFSAFFCCLTFLFGLPSLQCGIFGP